MKIECLRERLAHAVMHAEKITGKNLTLPVLGCIFFSVSKNILTVKATNLDLGIEISIPVKMEKEGSVAIPGSVINNFLSHITQEKNITLSVVDGNLLIATQKNTTTIKAFPPEDFPVIPRIKEEKPISISPSLFSKGLTSVWYSAAVGSMKPELSSIYIYPEDGSLVFVATDSFRLAEKRIKVKESYDFNPILIPFKNIPEIVRILAEADDPCSILINKHQISFLCGDTYLTSRIVEGVFPDYKQIIPKEHKTEITVLKYDLVNALKLANVFSDKFSQVNIKAIPSRKVMELRTKNIDIGEHVNKLDVAALGEDIDINFNHKNISDAFQSIDSDSVTLYFNALNRPMVMKGSNDKSFTYLVMPMNK